MPRRKKNGQSPARVPGGLPEEGSLGHSTGSRLPQGYDSAMATSESVSASTRENVVQSMQEMFSHLDPRVIYIVLSECDFKVENAVDSLLELSVAAEVAAPVPSSVSGFERTAAALLSPHHFSEARPEPDPSKPSQTHSPSPSSSLMTEDMDLLIDQELETLTAQDLKEDQLNSQSFSAGMPYSSFPPAPVPQQVLPELLQSSLEPGPRQTSAEQPCPDGGSVQDISGSSSPLNQLHTWKDQATEQSVDDFTHLMTETPVDKTKLPLDLAASGRPSAFQVYKKKDSSHTFPEKSGTMTSEDMLAAGARSKVNVTTSWNLDSPEFSPRLPGNQGPYFITPVAPSNWSSQLRHASPWRCQYPVSKAPLKLSATIPQSWAQPAAPRHPAKSNRFRLEGKVLVLLRGAPGSGKSTLARNLQDDNPGAVVLSTDDYFTRHGAYHFDPNALGEAHEWTHKRAKEAFERGAHPIIIDNTNMQGWEMKPYVAQALKHYYKVLFREPDTWWKNKPRELERRTTHNVPVETIRRMLNGFESHVTVQSIMGSRMPEVKQHLPLENRRSQLATSEIPCPDLVREPELTERCMNSHPYLFSSLPDVSTIGRSTEVGMLDDSSHKSTDMLNFQPTGGPVENSSGEGNDDSDMGALDSELDAHIEINHPTGDKRIPDCIVESVMNEDHHKEELPVAFSESIRQRMPRERQNRRSDFARMNTADLVKETNQSDTEALDKGQMKGDKTLETEIRRDQGEKVMPKMLDFVGDWPSEGSLEQRQVKRREHHKEGNGEEVEGGSNEANKNPVQVQCEPDVTEFQRLLDLIQTGVPALHTGSSCLSSLSPTPGEEMERQSQSSSKFEESHGRICNSEEKKQTLIRNISSRVELPDCVLDWKATDSCLDDGQGLKGENEASEIVPVNDNEAGHGGETLDLESTHTDAVVFPETTEAKGGETHDIEGGEGSDTGTPSLTERDIDTCTNQMDSGTKLQFDSSHISEEGQSPVCEGSGEAESSIFSGSSQERKQRQGRRSGKQCKLALTFTQNCFDHSLKTPECPNNADQNVNDSQNSVSKDSKLNLNPDYNTSPDRQPSIDLFPESKLEAHLQPSSPPPLVDTGCPTQTEPQDFALLWRLNCQDNPEGGTVYSHSSDITVLSGESSRFVPGPSSHVSVETGLREVPYRVVHEKGTQVEDKELGATHDRLESLCILSRHFKLVSFDTLEDLYDKCHHDLEWTTNLLLDSGERFFRVEEDEEDGEEKKSAEVKDDTSNLYDSSGTVLETRLDYNFLHDLPCECLTVAEPAGIVKLTQQSASDTVCETAESSDDTGSLCFGGAPSHVSNPDTFSHSVETSQTELSLPVAEQREFCDSINVTTESDSDSGAWAARMDNGVMIEESRVETEDEIATINEIQRLLQAEHEEMEREEKQRREERKHMEEKRSQHLDIQSVELKLPTELALQLTELFGPVGVDPGTCSSDDYAVQMDLSLAKLLHQKWKETIQKRQREATLSFHLLQESSVHWGESQRSKPSSRDRTQTARFLISTDGDTTLENQAELHVGMPFMDHWNVSRPHVSLRDIIKEEQALQKNMEKTRQSRADLDRRDGATLLKENQLYSLFPAIDRHFLHDIFRDHNYSLTQTELFLRSLLDEEPVKTVVAPEAPRSDHHRTASREREKRQKPLESPVSQYQDTENPEYEDFRAEAYLQRSRQLESFSKAAEAFKQGRKDVASFYAQQGHMHGQRMHEANHRAAVQIFEKVNSSLLPRNILDLHGLHVDEALEHLAQVLMDKTTDCEQGLCRPQLSVITGRGNHSQGGVARIRPAVIDYLTNRHYRFTEPKPGLVLVSLK